MEPNEYTVDTHIGRYVVRAPGRETRTVLKSKKCSCGGDAIHPCEHIQAVAHYLTEGGERAEAFDPIREQKPKGRITECPICGARVRWAGSNRYPTMWKCPKDSGHYWQWYGEGHGVKDFFTNGRPSGIAAIDSMTTEAYNEYLNTLEEARYGNRAGAAGPQG